MEKSNMLSVLYNSSHLHPYSDVKLPNILQTLYLILSESKFVNFDIYQSWISS